MPTILKPNLKLELLVSFSVTLCSKSAYDSYSVNANSYLPWVCMKKRKCVFNMLWLKLSSGSQLCSCCTAELCQRLCKHKTIRDSLHPCLRTPAPARETDTFNTTAHAVSRVSGLWIGLEQRREAKQEGLSKCWDTGVDEAEGSGRREMSGCRERPFWTMGAFGSLVLNCDLL